MNLAEFIFELDEGTRCWKGYERKGFKTMFGKRVPNCVKREDRYLVVDKFNEPVKLFDNEQEAVAYFKENYHLLNYDENPIFYLFQFLNQDILSNSLKQQNIFLIY